MENDVLVFFWAENKDFSKVMNSFFDWDQLALIERACAHYTLNLICSRRIFKILIGATKSSEGVNILSTA